MLIKDTPRCGLIFIVFNAFTYINLQVGSGGERGEKERKEKNLLSGKKKNASALSPSPETAQKQQYPLCLSPVMSYILGPKHWSLLFNHHITALAGLSSPLSVLWKFLSQLLHGSLLPPLKTPQGLGTPCAGSRQGSERCAFSSYLNHRIWLTSSLPINHEQGTFIIPF